MRSVRKATLNDADVERIRSVFERLVGRDEDDLTRITFENGDVFILRYLAESDEDDTPQSERDLVGAWDGSIVATHNLEADRRRSFVPGSGVIFYGSEVAKIEDELTGEILFSRTPGS